MTGQNKVNSAFSRFGCNVPKTELLSFSALKELHFTLQTWRNILSRSSQAVRLMLCPHQCANYVVTSHIGLGLHEIYSLRMTPHQHQRLPKLRWEFWKHLLLLGSYNTLQVSPTGQLVQRECSVQKKRSSRPLGWEEQLLIHQTLLLAWLHSQARFQENG